MNPVLSNYLKSAHSTCTCSTWNRRHGTAVEKRLEGEAARAGSVEERERYPHHPSFIPPVDIGFFRMTLSFPFGDSLMEAVMLSKEPSSFFLLLH
jgi:hypothetical protein